MVNWRLSARARHFRTMMSDRMKALGLTEAELAERIGTSQSAVSNALTGQTRFDIFRTERYCDALEWSIDHFLHEYERTAPHPEETHSREEEQACTDDWLDDVKADQEADDVARSEEDQGRDEALGTILAKLRNKAGPNEGKLPQRTLADAIGRPQSFISKAEHGRCAIHVALLETMAWHLGSTLTDVYSELQRVAPRSVTRGPARNDADDH